jgi:hypothetical protein
MVSLLLVDTSWDAAASFTLMVLSIILLVLLLVVKELALARGRQWKAFGRMLNVAIVPLVITFAVTVLVRILGAIP